MNLGGSIRINKCGVLIIFLLALVVIYYITSNYDTKPSTFAANKSPDEVNLRKLLIAAIVAAQKGGLEVLEVSKSANFGTLSKGKTKEGANDPVTDADFRSHCLMEQGLKNIFSKLQIVSEEDNGAKCEEAPLFNLDPTVLHEAVKLPDVTVPASELTVWIDPLDATFEFTEKLFQYVTTMVCVAHNGKPIIGVIHNPFSDKTTWAWEDKAFSEDLAKAKKPDEDPKNPVVIISRSHAGEVKELTKEVFGESVQVQNAAGAGYKILQVVFNNATAYLHNTTIKKWDLCAGNAILASLGGQMTDFDGKKISYVDDKNYAHTNGILATFSTTTHQQYIEKLKSNLHKSK